MAIADPPPLLILPFAAMLLAIAFAPVVVKHHWERHYHEVSVTLAAIPLGYYLLVLREPARVGGMLHVYLGFLALVGSLFVIAGGIHLEVPPRARPGRNVLFLFLGALAANVIGTTGAAMLLIRPWIRMNRERFTEMHLVFFIFIVANAGGTLTPIGNPPLLLGFLQGVPFWWMLQNCWKAWALIVGGLLLIFFFLDGRNFRRQPALTPEPGAWRCRGGHNLLFFGVVLGALFVDRPLGLREALMAAAAAGSFFTTGRAVHDANRFTFGPLKEVGWLFLGIFATMLPAIDYLQIHARELAVRFHVQTPAHFYWLTGACSAILDNAPTYLASLATAAGLAGRHLGSPEEMRAFAAEMGPLLAAISLGAVFFGAITYIGNGPNLMVKSIADEAGLKTPGFAGYVYRFSLPFLLPLILLVALLFFSGSSAP